MRSLSSAGGTTYKCDLTSTSILCLYMHVIMYIYIYVHMYEDKYLCIYQQHSENEANGHSTT